MKNQRIVQLAVMCLQALNAQAGQAVSPQEISRSQGVPLEECLRILRQFNTAGIVQYAEAGKVRLVRPVEDLTALEILEALWTMDSSQPEFRMLLKESRGAKLHVMLQLAERAKEEGIEING